MPLTMLFSMDPEDSCLIVSHDMPEDEMQILRDKFPKHTIVVACCSHAPSEGAFVAPSLALSNLPPCAILLTPDEDWNIPKGS